MGKTVSTEFAASAPGKTRNPHNPAHTPGGSSSGSAAAVAAGMVPLAMGTQTAGSLIRPGSFCGVVAYKPTRGTIDKTGVKPLADSLDTVGVMARNVRDAAFFASVLSDRPDLPESAAVAPRIGFHKTPHWDMAQPETHDAMERVRRVAEKQGACVIDIAAPDAFADLQKAHEVVMDREMLHALAFERLMHAEKLAKKTRDYLARPMPTPEAYDEAQRRATAARGHLGALFESCDVLLTPAAIGEAPEGRLDTTGDPTFNRIWTLLGVPCVTVPTWRGGGALPVGVQIVGKPGGDLQMFAAAAFIEAALAA
jgi:amidase